MIPRFQTILFIVLLAASLVMGLVLLHLRDRALDFVLHLGELGLEGFDPSFPILDLLLRLVGLLRMAGHGLYIEVFAGGLQLGLGVP